MRGDLSEVVEDPKNILKSVKAIQIIRPLIIANGFI
jgi:hypothetical protein